MTPVDVVYLVGIIPTILALRFYMIRADVARAERDYDYEVGDDAFMRGLISLFAGVLWPFVLAIAAIFGALFALGRKWS